MQKEPEHQSSCNAAAKNAARLLLMHSLLGGGGAQHSGGPAGKTSRRSISMGLARSHLAIDGADVRTLGLLHPHSGRIWSQHSNCMPSIPLMRKVILTNLRTCLIRTRHCFRRASRVNAIMEKDNNANSVPRMHTSATFQNPDCYESTVQVQPSMESFLNASASH